MAAASISRTKGWKWEWVGYASLVFVAYAFFCFLTWVYASVGADHKSSGALFTLVPGEQIEAVTTGTFFTAQTELVGWYTKSGELKIGPACQQPKPGPAGLVIVCSWGTTLTLKSPANGQPMQFLAETRGLQTRVSKSFDQGPQGP